jgi:stress-induced-phosphoprotein 1
LLIWVHDSEKFTQAIAIESENHILYSNRSAVYAAQADYEKALEDAEKAIGIKPDWSKGYARKGAAYKGMGDLCKEYIMNWIKITRTVANGL